MCNLCTRHQIKHNKKMYSCQKRIAKSLFLFKTKPELIRGKKNYFFLDDQSVFIWLIYAPDSVSVLEPDSWFSEHVPAWCLNIWRASRGLVAVRQFHPLLGPQTGQCSPGSLLWTWSSRSHDRQSIDEYLKGGLKKKKKKKKKKN